MPLQKQNLAVPFAVSLDLKTDPQQVMPTSMLSLVNTIFTKDKRLQKRNGFANLTALPGGTNPTTVTTFDGNLITIGNSVQAFSQGSNQWFNKGPFYPAQLSVLSLFRSSYSQSEVDAVTNGSNLVSAVFNNGNGRYEWIVSDSITSQALFDQLLPPGAHVPRTFFLGSYFIVTFLVTVSATPHLRYMAIPAGNLQGSVIGPTDISTQVASTSTGYDGLVYNDRLYVAWNGSDGGGAIRATFLTATLGQGNTVVEATQVADLLSLGGDISTPGIWMTWYTSSGTILKAMEFNVDLTTAVAPEVVSTSYTVNHITNVAKGGTTDIYVQVTNSYTYDSGLRTDFIEHLQANSGGTSDIGVLVRSLGLASKAFYFNGIIYVLGTYQGEFQPTYILIAGSGNAAARLAYSNGGGYISTSQVLPGVTLTGSTAMIGYLFKDLITSVNKDLSASSVPGIYTGLGVNLASFNLTGTNLSTVEIGSNLHIAGGFLWMYDGTNTVEHGFHFWPEDIEATWSSSGGAIVAKPDSSTNTDAYAYQVTYEWTDAQGNVHRSAPSIPVFVTTSGSGSTGSITLNIPTLRVTYKNQVRIVIYRWSVGQQNFFSVNYPAIITLSNPASDSITYIDTLADASIIGNPLIYTTGGVVENIAAPACNVIGLYRSRLMLIDAEDKNLLWFSKQVIETTPVETSDLFTQFIAPTVGSQGSTGPTLAISALDDKFIAFKENAIYYIVGNGPDNTGANNDFSEPTFITATVGCGNQSSIVFQPAGLMFQSDKGIWLLGRDLGTRYIGAPVEDFNSSTIVASSSVPGTNQVRFLLDNSQALMYDYYFGRWGSFTNIPAMSNTLYQGLHTYLTTSNTIRQESVGMYTDAGNPVLMSFTTAWMNLMGLQGFERAYQVYLLGNYISPHTLSVTIAYDYNTSPVQAVMISPTNFAGFWGTSSPFWGQDQEWGGPGNLEQWRIFLSTQKIQAFQVTVQEVFDSTLGTAPGAGLTFSGLNLVVGGKKGYVPLPAAQSVG